MITDGGIYNLKEKKIMRKIAIERFNSVTISTKSNEFLLHVTFEYDYRYISNKREFIIQFLIYTYEKKHN